MATSPNPTPDPTASIQPNLDTTVPEGEAIAKALATQEQADAILAELKVVKQRLFWLVIMVGFFAARALFFHY